MLSLLPKDVKEEVKQFINQPIDGLLYDLGLLPEQHLTKRERIIAEVIIQLHMRSK